MLLVLSSALPMFRTLIACGELEVVTPWLEKVNWIGKTLNPG
jgi:hypothetical protein